MDLLDIAWRDLKFFIIFVLHLLCTLVEFLDQVDAGLLVETCVGINVFASQLVNFFILFFEFDFLFAHFFLLFLVQVVDLVLYYF